MTDPQPSLFAFQDFVASISYTGDDLALAEQIGQAKALLTDVAMNINEVRQSVRTLRYTEPAIQSVSLIQMLEKHLPKIRRI